MSKNISAFQKSGRKLSSLRCALTCIRNPASFGYGPIVSKLCWNPTATLTFNSTLKSPAGYSIFESLDVLPAKLVSAHKLDAEIWRKTWEHISDPVRFEADIQAAIAQEQAKTKDATADCERLRAKLDNLAMNEQRLIRWGLDGVITEDAMQTQLTALYIERSGVQRELAEKSVLTGNRMEQLLEVARVYRENLVAGYTGLDFEPTTEEERQLQFEARRTIVQGIVERVDVGADKTPNVKLNHDFTSVLCISDAPA